MAAFPYVFHKSGFGGWKIYDMNNISGRPNIGGRW